MEYKLVGDTKTPLLRCIPFNIKNGNKIFTGQYIKYQSFTNLQFSELIKKYFR